MTRISHSLSALLIISIANIITASTKMTSFIASTTSQDIATTSSHFEQNIYFSSLSRSLLKTHCRDKGGNNNVLAPVRHCFATRTSIGSLLNRHRKQGTRMFTATTERDFEGSLATSNQRDASSKDRREVVFHMLKCLGAATMLSMYEDYDCSNLKPARATLRRRNSSQQPLRMFFENDIDYDSTRIIGSATRGMGQSQQERMGRYEYDGNEATKDIPSYNEVMQHHRDDRVAHWRTLHTPSKFSGDRTKSLSIKKEEVTQAAVVVVDALNGIFQASNMANEYEWDQLKLLLKSDLFVVDMPRACALLQSATNAIPSDGRAEVGFDWGSCAWRHCGALADTQETLAELHNNIGMFEPFECLFCLDVAERSLRDILAIVPAELRPVQARSLPTYVPLKTWNAEIDEGQGGKKGGADTTGQTADYDNLDFMDTLKMLRNNFVG